MAWNNLKEAIAAVIKTNGNKEITGQLLQETLNGIVNILGNGFQFAGSATPLTEPGVTDGKIFYIATEPGVYRNFDHLIVSEHVVAFLLYNNGWKKEECSISDPRVRQLQTDLNTVKPSEIVMSDLMLMPLEQFIEKQCGCFLVPSSLADFPGELKETDSQAYLLTQRNTSDGVQILIGAQTGFQYTRRLNNGILTGWNVVQGSTIYFATFDINTTTGMLEMHTDPGYSGANFNIENGNLTVTI